VFADAVERLREFTASPDAWSVAYETMLDADLSRVPHCTEQLMTLISEITGGRSQWRGEVALAGRKGGHGEQQCLESKGGNNCL